MRICFLVIGCLPPAGFPPGGTLALVVVDVIRCFLEASPPGSSFPARIGSPTIPPTCSPNQFNGDWGPLVHRRRVTIFARARKIAIVGGSISRGHAAVGANNKSKFLKRPRL